MAFVPKAGDTLVIDQVEFRLAEHPAAEGMPYGQEGRAAVVYQLLSVQGKSALKVFKPRFRRPSLVSLSERIGRFATLAGMTACTRTVLTARRHPDLLHEHPDLTYSVVMPWIDGPTWTEVLLNKGELSREDSLRLARALAEILAGLEEQGLAHCDLSGPNVIIPALATSPVPTGLQPVELVDMEQIYGPGLENPEVLLSGSGGYAPRYAERSELWTAKADRFAGALLIVEMLGWCDAAVREASWSESYFDPDEIQQTDSARYTVLIEALQRQWGSRPTDLFADVWRSETLEDCPTFGEWLVKMPRLASLAPQSTVTPAAAIGTGGVNALIERAGQLEAQGDLAGALESYRQALQAAPQGSGLAQELALILVHLEAKMGNSPQAPTAPAIAPNRGNTKQPTEMDRLFTFGLAAYNRGEWRGAQEMFRAIVNSHPGYTSDGQSAEALLADVDRRIAAQDEQAAGGAPMTRPGVAAIAAVPPAPATGPTGLGAAESRTDQPAATVTGAAGTTGPHEAPPPKRTVVDVPARSSNRLALVGGILGLVLVLALVGFFLLLNRSPETLPAVTGQNATDTPTAEVAQVDEGATATVEAAMQADADATAEAEAAAQAEADATATAEELALLEPTATQPEAEPTEPADPVVPAAGQVTFHDAVLASDQAVITLDPPPTIPRGKALYGWFTDSATGDSVRVGRLLRDQGNNFMLTYSGPGNGNLLGLYDGFKVTAEDVEGQPQAPSDEVLLVGQLPPEAVIHIRHLLVTDEDSPNQASLAVAMLSQLDVVLEHAQYMRDHQAAGLFANVRLHGEHLVNIIDGVNGLYYGDLNKDGQVQNPGDGVGLLVGNNEIGYIQHAIDHADKSASLPDATENIQLHAGHVTVSMENVRGWITSIRDLSLQVADAPNLEATKPLSDEILDLANRAINGQPYGDNAEVLPVSGSGSVHTAYEHAQLMAAIDLAPPDTTGAGTQPDR